MIPFRRSNAYCNRLESVLRGEKSRVLPRRLMSAMKTRVGAATTCKAQTKVNVHGPPD